MPLINRHVVVITPLYLLIQFTFVVKSKHLYFYSCYGRYEEGI